MSYVRCSGFGIPKANWTNALPNIRSIINNSLFRRLGNCAVTTVRTGIPAAIPIKIALSMFQYSDVQSAFKTASLPNLEIEKFLETLDSLHSTVDASQSKSRDKAVERYDTKLLIIWFKLTVGYYVKVIRTSGHRTKMSIYYVGPKRISKNLFGCTLVMEHFIKGNKSIAYCSYSFQYASYFVDTLAAMHFVVQRIEGL